MMTTPFLDLQEKELLLRLREGDERAFKVVYHRYKRRLAGNMLRVLKDDELVEELLQDLFMKLWDKRAVIDPEKPIKAYLFKIAENLIADFFRRAAREKALKQHLMNTSTEVYLHIEEQLIDRENWALLEAAVEQLPPQRKKVFVCCKLDGKSYQEVSDELQISVKTVADHMLKATKFLKDYMANHPHITGMILAMALLHGL